MNEPELRSAVVGGAPGSGQASSQSNQHSGRDAAAGGLLGAGAGGAAAHGLSNKDAAGQVPQQTSSAAAGHPGGQGYPTSAGTSTAPAGQTGGQQHHYGRDAALAGGAGAAGVGAYELGKNRQDDGASPETSRLHERNVAGVDPSTQREAEDLKPGQEKQHHYGRDAAVAGGTGAAGVGAYELAKDKNESSKHTGPHDTNVANASDSRVQSQPDQLKSVNKPNEPSMAGQDPQQQQQQQQHHYGRDAAVAGGAGVAGVGAYEALKDRDQVPSNMAKGGDPTVDASKHPAETWDPNRIAQKQKEIKNEQQGEPTDKAAEKAAKEQKSGGGIFGSHDDKEDKKAAKQQEKADKQAEKEAEKEQKSGGGIFGSHDDKEDKKAAKQQEKAEKEHEKEEKKAAKQQEKIAKEEKKEEEKAAKQHKKEQEEEEKEKKPGLISRILHPGRKSGEGEDERSREGTPESNRLSADHRGSGDNRVSEDERGHHKLHKKSVEQQHGNGGDGRVTEPHTGLPMNTEKYGTGAGGTDGSQQIGGYQSQGTGSGIGPAEGEEQGVAGPDWNAIKKANTPY